MKGEDVGCAFVILVAVAIISMIAMLTDRAENHCPPIRVLVPRSDGAFVETFEREKSCIDEWEKRNE